MAINKVGSKGIEDGSVATAEFPDCAVTSAKLTDGTITNAKLVNSAFTLNGSSVSLGGSISVTARADWQSVITADGSTITTAVSGKGYFIDTTSAAHTITLPASASIGDFIAIKDYAGTFATNNLTIARNGHNIQGLANNSEILTSRASLVLVYVDSTKGWLYWEEHNVASLENKVFITATGGTITTSGDYKIHTFTGDGCFTVCTVGNPAGSDSVDYLVVAGGGAGGYAYIGTPGNPYSSSGGGGAGGFRESVPSTCAWSGSPLANPGGALPVSATTYPITVGAGGSAPTSTTSHGGDGSNSSFSTITSTGGGGGRPGYGNPPLSPAGSGGSGGGGSGAPGTNSPARASGSGNSPPVSPPQGQPGTPGSFPGTAAGGGGGALNAGQPYPEPGTGANGGGGATTSISGSSTAYAGGGGGGGNNPRGSGGVGGGGASGFLGDPFPNSQSSVGGTANRGGGGGGGAGSQRNNPHAPFAPYRTGGSGGKGIVILRYKYQ